MALKEIYWQRVRDGICAHCGKKPPEPKRRRCAECLESSKSTYYHRIANHLCVRCEVQLPKDLNKVRCNKCARGESLCSENNKAKAVLEIFDRVKEAIEPNVGPGNWKINGIVETPKGIRQESGSEFGFEYVDQRSYMEDLYYGEIYYPLGKYFIEVSYNA